MRPASALVGWRDEWGYEEPLVFPSSEIRDTARECDTRKDELVAAGIRGGLIAPTTGGLTGGGCRLGSADEGGGVSLRWRIAKDCVITDDESTTS